MSTEASHIVDDWFSTSGITLGPVILDGVALHRVKRLMYTYREINATELKDIPPTDLYEYKVRLKEGTKPFSAKGQKRWPLAQKNWLDKIIHEGLECGVFERTMTANRELSDWNA